MHIKRIHPTDLFPVLERPNESPNGAPVDLSKGDAAWPSTRVSAVGERGTFLGMPRVWRDLPDTEIKLSGVSEDNRNALYYYLQRENSGAQLHLRDDTLHISGVKQAKIIAAIRKGVPTLKEMALSPPVTVIPSKGWLEWLKDRIPGQAADRMLGPVACTFDASGNPQVTFRDGSQFVFEPRSFPADRPRGPVERPFTIRRIGAVTRRAARLERFLYAANPVDVFRYHTSFAALDPAAFKEWQQKCISAPPQAANAITALHDEIPAVAAAELRPVKAAPALRLSDAPNAAQGGALNLDESSIDLRLSDVNPEPSGRPKMPQPYGGEEEALLFQRGSTLSGGDSLISPPDSAASSVPDLPMMDPASSDVSLEKINLQLEHERPPTGVDPHTAQHPPVTLQREEIPADAKLKTDELFTDPASIFTPDEAALNKGKAPRQRHWRAGHPQALAGAERVEFVDSLMQEAEGAIKASVGGEMTTGAYQEMALKDVRAALRKRLVHEFHGAEGIVPELDREAIRAASVEAYQSRLVDGKKMSMKEFWDFVHAPLAEEFTETENREVSPLPPAAEITPAAAGHSGGGSYYGGGYGGGYSGGSWAERVASHSGEEMVKTEEKMLQAAGKTLESGGQAAAKLAIAGTVAVSALAMGMVAKYGIRKNPAAGADGIAEEEARSPTR